MGVVQLAALLASTSGAAVVVADLDPDAGRETVDRIRAAGGEATFVETDVSDEAEQ